jgi:hypothetical protein
MLCMVKIFLSLVDRIWANWKNESLRACFSLFVFHAGFNENPFLKTLITSFLLMAKPPNKKQA